MLSSKYFGLELFCPFEARVPDMEPFPLKYWGGWGSVHSGKFSGTLASDRQTTSNPKCIDADLTIQYIISVCLRPHLFLLSALLFFKFM